MFDSVGAETIGASSNLFGEVVGAIGKTIKIQIARNALLAELSLLAEVVEPKSLMPSLNYLLIEAARNRVILRAASLNNTLQCEIGADVIEAGGVCLPARKLYEIVRQLPSETITISGNEHYATLKCVASRFNLNAISPDDFPEAPAAAESFTPIPRDVLLRLIYGAEDKYELEEACLPLFSLTRWPPEDQNAYGASRTEAEKNLVVLKRIDDWAAEIETRQATEN